MPQTIVITGGAGFIGSHLARSFVARGVRVVAVDNFDPFYAREMKLASVRGIDPRLFELVEADIRDASALGVIFERARPACVYHMAALAGVRPSLREPRRYADVNVAGLVGVLEATCASGCEQFVFASSSSVYGNRSSVPFAEDDPVSEPISPYAATKRAGELVCHTWAHLYGLRTACLRFFTVYGPGQRPDLAISTFMRSIAAGQEITLFGDGTTSRDYTFIDDIVQGVHAAGRRVDAADEGSYRIYNLGGSTPVTLGDLVEQISRVVGERARVRHVPIPPGDVLRTYADLTRRRAELAFHPETPLSEGLPQQWQWMQRVDGEVGSAMH